MVSRLVLLPLMLSAFPLFTFSVAAQTAKPGWTADARTGCLVWNPSPEPKADTTIKWSGACTESGAEGRGVLEWFVDGKLFQRYEGALRAGKEEGAGVLTYADGSGYEGEFRDGRFNGHGVYAYAGQGRHEGEYRDGKAHGPGVYLWENGSRYEGEFGDGKRNGKGSFTSAEGHRYDGEYRDNKPNGKGTFESADGELYWGTWSNGCLRQGDSWAIVGVTKEECGFE
jgi:hypothetical protein